MKLDLHAKNPIKLREIIVAACVALSMFVVGCFLDFKFTNTVYHPGTHAALSAKLKIVALNKCFKLYQPFINQSKIRKWFNLTNIAYFKIIINEMSQIKYNIAKLYGKVV